MSWQDIETAPKDGSSFIAYDGNGCGPMHIRWEANWECWVLAGVLLKLDIEEDSDAPAKWCPVPTMLMPDLSVLPETAFDRLSSLERERVESEANETLYQVFNSAHNATGWCGDIMQECWQAGLPVMRETLARLILRTR
jgi:hypothetical protein